MKLVPTVGLALLPLTLTGCVMTAAPTRTAMVTVTPAPAPASLRAGGAAPWDLHAVCAAEAAISTLEQWRRYQAAAGRLSGGHADAIVQSIAVQYLEVHEFSTASPVQEDVDALAQASGTLDHPTIDLKSAAVETARAGLHQTCIRDGLTIGVYAQGG